MVYVLDLDDTLYDERQFVEGGLRAAAAHMAKAWDIPARAALKLMREELAANGRGRLFDVVLDTHGLHSKQRVRECLAAYRSHAPNLRLHADAKRFLERLRGRAIYVVTDGNPRVQRRKARALGLHRIAKRVMPTWQYGRGRSKPSPHVFLRIAAAEGVRPSQIIHVADNPHKDFVKLKPLGFRTVRVLRGPFKDVRLPKRFEAHRTIRSLDDV